MDYLFNGEETEAIIKAALKRINSPYCWPCEENKYSGKDLKDALYPGTYDCSGLVSSSIFDGTGGKLDRRTSWNAQRMLKNCALVDMPEPGDLAFYGMSTNLVTHVMLYIGNGFPELRPDGGKMWTVYGSSGGDSRTTDPEKAKLRDAKVTGYRSHKYRSDFLCFGRLVTSDR